MSTVNVILPIDKKRSAQMLALLQMFEKRANLPMAEIIKIIPKSTFFALLYRLRLIARLIRQRHGFDMFLFEVAYDFDAKKEVKVMKLNAEMSITNLDGCAFVEFVKAL